MPLPTLVKNGQIDINSLREEYLKAVNDDKGIEYLLGILAKNNSSDALVLAYQACLETLKAKILWNPLEKLALAKQSQHTFAKAVSSSPNNLEIRFLRYSIQLSLPSYLYLSNDLEEDKNLILKLIQEVEVQQIGTENLKRIADFMLQKGQCSQAEKKVISLVYTKL
ncbi:MAG: hypothetical protein EAZ08_08245 [Cytophagales bacterium]|nr:MAG: hypothetical protein EAZ08_08245 [Cytophagales bacterium]